MSEDIGAMTLELAQDPSSLVFLPLGEALRRRGQLDAALTVVQRGVARYPVQSDGHDLLARIQSDRGDGESAFDAWTTVLKLSPNHLGAHKGLAFLAYRSGDLGRCVRHLSKAQELAPEDTSLSTAIERIRSEMAARVSAVRSEPGDPSSNGHGAPDAPPVNEPKSADSIPLLFDLQGRVLRGAIASASGYDASEAIAAALAGISREAERAAQLLGLGEWRGIAIESGPVNYELRQPTAETLLLVTRGREVPAGRLSRIADRAVHEARQWMEEIG